MDSPARLTPRCPEGHAGGNARQAAWREGSTHSSQRLLDVFSGSRNVTEDHTGAILLQMVQREPVCFFQLKLKKKKSLSYPKAKCSSPYLA